MFGKLQRSQTTTAHKVKVGINYLELPIQLAYSFEAGDGNLVVGAGPYAAYALNGKVTASANGQTTTESLDFGTSEAQTRFDYGLYLSAGYELSSGLGISLYYAPGLANLTNSTASAQATTKNTSYGISIGYFFGSRD